MKIRRKEITEVFTPRNATVNAGMYIQRDALEKALHRSVRGSMHSFLYGESGNGKTWLYKSVFNAEDIKYVVANCARASQNGSLTDEILSACKPKQKPELTSSTQEAKSGLSIGVGSGNYTTTDVYEPQKPDKLLDAYSALNGGVRQSKKVAVIVLDNVETILKNREMLDELANIIILLDDERYAKYRVKFLIVGVPNEVLQYFTSSRNPSSVGNRIDEVSRVTGLTGLQVDSLLRKGFLEQLKIKITEEQFLKLAQHIYGITLGVPQRVHEYCESLAYLLEDNRWEYSPTLLDTADQQWLIKGLRESYSIISSLMNSDETFEGRRNQVIYCIGKTTTHQIDTNAVGSLVSEEFPRTAPESNSGIGRVLSHLCSGETPILKKLENSDCYVISDPRLLMCIRVALVVDTNTENVSKKKFSNN